MYKIGDFSKLSRVPVKTLRYYDEIGLLKPSYVDPVSGYRFYSAAQLPCLNRILALKDLGLSLAQIAALIAGSLPPEQIRGMLRRKQAELEERLSLERARLARVEVRLRQIEQENSMPSYECVLKNIPTMRVASLRGIVPAYNQQNSLWEPLEAAIRQAGIRPTGPCFVLDHNMEFKERDVDLEACEPVEANTPTGLLTPDMKIRVWDLPAIETAASTVHHGPFNTLYQAYPALMRWIEENGFAICGTGREIYVYTGAGCVRQDDPSYVAEILFPVQKK